MNPWSSSAQLSAQDTAQMAAFLEERAQTPDQQVLYRALIAAVGPRPGEHFLDVGCGTGIVARMLAAYVGETGSVVGVDLSPAMLAAARARSSSPVLHFEQGDVNALPYDTGTFSGATAVRLLLHVPNPRSALAELRRVVRPGGRLALLEWDWGTLALDHSQRALTRRILDWRCDNVGGDNWIGRQLARLCSESGWHVCEVQVPVSVACDEGTALLSSLRRAAQAAAANGIISAGEHHEWIAEIDHRLQHGAFFATINDYLVLALNPIAADQRGPDAV